jgi:hypothetical protein
MPDHDPTLQRWRLILGRFAEDGVGGLEGDAHAQRVDRVLDYLYGREYAGRGLRGDDPTGKQGGFGGGSPLSVPQWIGEVRDLFPHDVVETVEKHALDRYGLTQLVTDPDTLRKLEPSYELLKSVMAFKGMMKGEVLDVARSIIRRVVEDLQRRLATDVRRVLWGKLSRRHRSPLKVAANLDVRRTLRDNLKHFDRERNQLVVDKLHFFGRVQQHIPWHVVMAVDCSGSMADSVIYSAVMAGIFRGLPSLKVSLVAFDTSVIDLTDRCDDPTEVLMSVQLGGGTDIGGAVGYCSTLINNPHRTIFVLVTDFYEGGPQRDLLRNLRAMREGGVRILGLAALDETGRPFYDKDTAARCAAAGAEVAAVSPQRLAEWIGGVLK